MELTPVFNAEARGDGGQTPADAGPDITDPGGGSASAAVEKFADPSANEPPSPVHSTSRKFEYAQAVAHPASLPDRADEAVNMAAMIEMLEKGRAKPSLNFNLRPERALEKNVHKKVEFDREKLISEFRAAQPEPSEWDHQIVEGLELFF